MPCRVERRGCPASLSAAGMFDLTQMSVKENSGHCRDMLDKANLHFNLASFLSWSEHAHDLASHVSCRPRPGARGVEEALDAIDGDGTGEGAGLATVGRLRRGTAIEIQGHEPSSRLGRGSRSIRTSGSEFDEPYRSRIAFAPWMDMGGSTLSSPRPHARGESVSETPGVI